MLAYLDHSLVEQTNENHPFSHSVIHCFPLECVCGGGCPHPECYLQQWGTPVSDNDNSIKHLQETRIKLICPKMPLIFPCQRDALGLVSTAPFPIQFSPGHGLVCGPVNTPTRVQHSLQGRCLARAGLDNMWYIFTPLLQNEELERAPEHCDSSTMRLFPLAWKHSFHCGLQHCSGWSVLPCDFSHLFCA